MVGPTLPDDWASIKAGRRNATRQEIMGFIVRNTERRMQAGRFRMLCDDNRACLPQSEKGSVS